MSLGALISPQESWILSYTPHCKDLLGETGEPVLLLRYQSDISMVEPLEHKTSEEKGPN
jgi:hypothetical protein